MHGVVQDDPRRHEELPKAGGVDAPLVVLPEVDPALAEELDGVIGVDVAAHIEFPEIELPDAEPVGAAGGEVAVLVGEGETELDQFKEIDVGLQRLVEVVGGGFEAADAAEDDAGELGVHGDVGVVVDNVADLGEFLLEVVLPDVSDDD
eukprot:TRINITY_DN288_c2_g2_i1.p2 TRINITY_DN288_c2_g2~~TRINITY_DN288_c2_g2_i1.p2  ORF type:complete len:149 (+),score=17.55 TRINITY_DN288_c2_g2_i1:506-952(+)